MVDITVPRLNTNDTAYHLTEWLVEDGATVHEGEPVVVLESSKAAQELDAGAGGILRRTAEAGRDYEVGHVLGRVHAAGEVPEVPPAAPAPAAAETSAGVVVTDPARALAAELGIDESRLLALGRPLVRRSDVADLARAGTAPERVRLSPNQVAVAAVVSASHAAIPAAFSALTVDLEPALRFGRRVSRERHAMIGPTEIVVKAVAALRAGHPLHFATFEEPHTARLSDGAHVGITMDVGEGLFVPVVRDVERSSLASVARATMAMRIAALDNRFEAGDLAGASIMVAVTGEEGVLLTQPVISPGLACAVSLGGARREYAPGADGSPRARTVMTIGLAYDHRLVNGRAAVAFLTELKHLVEHPESLDDR